MDKVKLIGLSLGLASALGLIGCGSGTALSPADSYKSMIDNNKHDDKVIDANTKAKNDLANVFGNSATAGMMIVAENAPDIKPLEKYISSDVEEVYYFNLLKDYIHSPSNIQTITTETIINSSDEEKRQLKELLNKKFAGKISDTQLDQIVNDQLGGSKGTSKTIKQTVLAKLPSDASSSIVSLKSINIDTKELGTIATAKDMIKLTYKFNNKSQSQEKLASVTEKIKHFLSNDKSWAIDDAASQNAVKDAVLTSDRSDPLIKKLKKQIKEAKARGEDTTYMEQGLAKFTNEAVNKNYAKSNNSAFVYSWYEGDKKGRHIVTIRLNAQEDLFTVEIMKSIVMM